MITNVIIIYQTFEKYNMIILYVHQLCNNICKDSINANYAGILSHLSAIKEYLQQLKLHFGFASCNYLTVTCTLVAFKCIWLPPYAN